MKTVLALLFFLVGCTEITFQVPEDTDMYANTAQNYGNQVTVLGTDTNATTKLLRLPHSKDNEPVSAEPWIIAVSGSALTGGSANKFLGLVARGNFGTGGASHNVELDVKPDSVLSLPGTSVDLNVEWDVIYLSNAGGTPPVKTRTLVATGSALPTSAIAKATAKHGKPVTANATRTIVSFNESGGVAFLVLDIPPFSSEYMLYTAEAQYGNITGVTFFVGAAIVAEYTGAQVLAIKNAGGFIPLPGTVDRFQVAVAADTPLPFYNTFFLNL